MHIFGRIVGLIIKAWIFWNTCVNHRFKMDLWYLCCQFCAICSWFSMSELSTCESRVCPLFRHEKSNCIPNFHIWSNFRYYTLATSFKFGYWIWFIKLFKQYLQLIADDPTPAPGNIPCFMMGLWCSILRFFCVKTSWLIFFFFSSMLLSSLVV